MIGIGLRLKHVKVKWFDGMSILYDNFFELKTWFEFYVSRLFLFNNNSTIYLGRLCLETMDNSRISTFEWKDERTISNTDFFNRAN